MHGKGRINKAEETKSEKVDTSFNPVEESTC